MGAVARCRSGCVFIPVPSSRSYVGVRRSRAERWLFHRVVRRWGVLYHSAVRRWECPVLSHRAQCAGLIRRCGFPSRCARMGCWSVFPLHRAVRRWECPSCLTPRSAQGGSGGAAFPRAVRGWGVGPFLFFLHRAVRRWECPSGLTAARYAGWIGLGVLMLQRNAQTLSQTL